MMRMDLLTAAKEGNTSEIKKLISQGTKINATREPNGDYAIHNSVRYGHYEATKLLIKKGADVNAMNNFGGTPLHKAIRGGYDNLIQLLIKHGADAHILKHYGETDLHHAARTGHIDIIIHTHEMGANINQINNFGDTALHRAAWNGHLVIVEYLLDNNADTTVRNNDGDTANDLAKQRGYMDISECILHKQSQRTEINSVVSKMSELMDDKYTQIKSSKEQLELLDVELQAKEIESADTQEQLTEATKLVETLRSKNVKLNSEIGQLKLKMEQTKKQILDSQNDLQNMKNMTIKKETPKQRDLEDDLTCPICMEIPLPPKKVFQCTEGHMFCDACKKSLKTCPECRVDLSGVLIRSRRVEEIIQKLFA